MEGAFASPSEHSFGLLSRLGAALSDSFSTFDREQWSLGELSASEIETIAADPSFRQPLRRAVAQKAASSLAAVPRDDYLAMSDTREGKLAVGLLSAPLAEVLDFSLLVSGAAFHRDILAATGKAERAALRESLGQPAYLLATQEARGLYPALGLLGDPQSFRAIVALGEAEAARRHFAGHGLALLMALCRPAAAALCELVPRRLPSGFPLGRVPAAPADDLARLFRLIDRRRPAWLATIG